MTKKIERNYLEINSLTELNSSTVSSNDYLVKLINPVDFEINKFFYKNIGKKHHWVDRLSWTNEQWIKYTSDVKLKTYVLQKNNDLAGYFELISHTENLNLLSKRLKNSIIILQRERSDKLIQKLNLLDSLSPLSVIARGYSVTLDLKGKPLNSIRKTYPGDKLQVRIKDGIIQTKVISVKHKRFK